MFYSVHVSPVAWANVQHVHTSFAFTAPGTLGTLFVLPQQFSCLFLVKATEGAVSISTTDLFYSPTQTSFKLQRCYQIKNPNGRIVKECVKTAATLKHVSFPGGEEEDEGGDWKEESGGGWEEAEGGGQCGWRGQTLQVCQPSRFLSEGQSTASCLVSVQLLSAIWAPSCFLYSRHLALTQFMMITVLHFLLYVLGRFSNIVPSSALTAEFSIWLYQQCYLGDIIKKKKKRLTAALVLFFKESLFKQCICDSL